LGEVFRVRIGHDAPCLIPQGELGIAEQGVVGGGDEATRHFQDGVGGSGLDAGGQLLGLGFQCGRQGFTHGGSPGAIPQHPSSSRRSELFSHQLP
jgi:hypothetical protein